MVLRFWAGKDTCAPIIEAWLRREALRNRRSQPLSATDLVQATCMDGTDLRAWSSRSLNDNKRGHSDPDARLGRGRKDFYLSYRTIFLACAERLCWNG